MGRSKDVTLDPVDLRSAAVDPAGSRGTGRRWLEGLAAAGVIYLIVIVFFRALVFGGQVFDGSSDSLAALIFERWGRGAIERGFFPLWNPYLFSGMPSFGSLQFAPGVYPVHWFKGAYALLLFGGASQNILIHHILGGLFAFLLLRDFKLETPLALFGAIVFFFSPQEIVLGPVAHGGKLFTIAWLPLVLLLTRRLLRRPDLLSTALLAGGLALQLLALHMQIAYYGLLMIALWFVVDAVEHRSERGRAEHLRRLGALAGAGLLALALAAYLYWPVYEYSQFSIRGGSAVGGGVSYDYATNWSFHPLEILTLFIPSWFGFGGGSYWGYMPFTDHPYYFGLVPLLLASSAVILRRRDKGVIALTVLAGFSLLMAFGKWLPVLYAPLFKLLPFFGKFRIPAMIMILFLLAMAGLAALGLEGLLRLEAEQREKWTKILRLTAIGAGLLFLIMLVAGEGFRSGYVAAATRRLADTRFDGNMAAARPFAGEAFRLFRTDCLRVLAVTGLAAGTLLLTLKHTLARTAGVAIVALLVTVDLWVVNDRLVETRPRAEHAAEIETNTHAAFLQEQDGPFRIVNLDLPVPANYWMSQGIEDAEGYSPAKLRIYQQVLERFQQQRLVSLPLWSMLNVRYLVVSTSTSAQLPEGFTDVFASGGFGMYEYDGALGPAWLVGEVIRARDSEQILEAVVRGFDASQVALTAEEIAPIERTAAQAGRVELLERSEHLLRYQVEAPGPVLLVMSEVYYPAGWRAEVAGEPAPIHRVDHLLRAVRVDPSAHGGTCEVSLTFAPRSVYGGRTLSLAALLVGLGLAVGGAVARRRRRPSADATAGEDTGAP